MIRNMRNAAPLLLFVTALLALPAACSSDKTASVVDPGPSPADGSAGRYRVGSGELGDSTASSLGDAYPLVEGLHVTGTPIDVDLATYRLTVEGAVERPLALSYEELQAFPRKRSFETLVCPGFFTDEGHWTGVPLEVLLERAGVREGAQSVDFVAADGSYRSSLTLRDAREARVLIAYQFDDRPLPKIHGFPLRVIAPGQAGSVWVKWLGKIVVE
jgi:DMSO/TMAO reductase YedYZ molybdopterin-dependent catalytic subunit